MIDLVLSYFLSLLFLFSVFTFILFLVFTFTFTFLYFGLGEGCDVMHDRGMTPITGWLHISQLQIIQLHDTEKNIEDFEIDDII